MTSCTSQKKLIFKSISLGELRVGFQLGSHIQDTEGKLLLAQGVTITAELLQKLQERGIRKVSIDKRDWEKLNAFQAKGISRKSLPHHSKPLLTFQTAASNEMDDIVSAGVTTTATPEPNPFAAVVEHPGPVPFDQALMEVQFEQHQQTVDQVASLVEALEKGQDVSAQQLESISHENLMQAAKDMDLFVCMGINPAENRSVFDHSANVARLAIAIGANMGLNEQSLRELGAGCLIHDAGMLQLNDRLYQTKRRLKPAEFIDIARHPILSADLLHSRMTQIPIGIRMIVYQMHERCDGSGYPRGWKGDRIHFLAKIAAVADTYIALVSSRPHRRAMLPYSAVKQILEDVNQGMFDPQVARALLHTISLFPLGSFVHLNDNRVGKVMRVNGAIYDRPIVECWERCNLVAEPDIVDLRNEPIRVAKALTCLG